MCLIILVFTPALSSSSALNTLVPTVTPCDAICCTLQQQSSILLKEFLPEFDDLSFLQSPIYERNNNYKQVAYAKACIVKLKEFKDAKLNVCMRALVDRCKNECAQIKIVVTPLY